MNQLITYLQPHMKFNCVVKKIGTLLYPRCGDLLKCLSLALYDSKCISGSRGYQPAAPKHKVLKCLVYHVFLSLKEVAMFVLVES